MRTASSGSPKVYCDDREEILRSVKIVPPEYCCDPNIRSAAPRCEAMRRIFLLISLLLVSKRAQAQVTGWASFLTYQQYQGQMVNEGEPVVLGVAPPILGTTLSSITPSSPPAWFGALTSTPANLGGAWATATDAAGDSYTL